MTIYQVIEKMIHLTNSSYFLDRVSNTFHGRDIFAPAAAHLSKDFNAVLKLGGTINEFVKYQIPVPEKSKSSLQYLVKLRVAGIFRREPLHS